MKDPAHVPSFRVRLADFAPSRKRPRMLWEPLIYSHALHVGVNQWFLCGLGIRFFLQRKANSDKYIDSAAIAADFYFG